MESRRPRRSLGHPGVNLLGLAVIATATTYIATGALAQSGGAATCVTPALLEGRCVGVQSCPQLSRLTRRGYTPTASEAHILRVSRCGDSVGAGGSNNDFQVCCATGSVSNGGANVDRDRDEEGPEGGGTSRGQNNYNLRPRPTHGDSTTRRPYQNPSPPRDSYGSGSGSGSPYRPGNDRNRNRDRDSTTRRPYGGSPTQTGTGSDSGSSDSLFPVDVCGLINEDRIIGGNISNLFELPFMVRLGYGSRGGRSRISYRCGGSLINSRYVLTAAHCVGGGDDPVQVRLGELDADSDPDCTNIGDIKTCADPVVDVDVERIIAHPDFSLDENSPDYLKNDIALLKLKRTVRFSESVSPICLPEGKSTLSGKKMSVAGWGKDRNGAFASGTRLLMKAKVPVTADSECARQYERRGLSVDASTQVCAGGQKGVDSCSGDSGGPLYAVAELRGLPRTVQYGVVSFGLQRCAVDGVPGVYTRVDHYLPWIKQNMK